MPYKDKQKRLEHSREYSAKIVKAGYGKALYARRKKHYENEERLRLGVHQAIADLEDGEPTRALRTLLKTRREAPEIKNKPLDELTEILGLDSKPTFKAHD